MLMRHEFINQHLIQLTPSDATTTKDTADPDTEKVRWDFSIFGYSGVDDPALDNDVNELEKRAAMFSETYKGKLNTLLGPALADYESMEEISAKVFGYLFLKNAQNLGDEAVKTKMKMVQERWSTASAKHLTFFSIEINKLTDEQIDHLAKKDQTVTKYLPYLRQVRLFKKHQLAENVEEALSLRDTYGAGTWADFYEEQEAKLRFPFENKELTLAEIIDILNDKNRDRRSGALYIINKILGEKFSDLATQSLNILSGSWRVEDEARGYPHSMASRNMSNMLSDQTVEALHQAVENTAAPLAQRFYRLKKQLLGIEDNDVLRWSDRNAPLPFADDTRISYREGEKIVLDAYRSFSPTLAALIETMSNNNWIDAPTYPGKSSGAFNMSLVLPGKKAVSFVLLNFLGKSRDVMTDAHEKGHGVHGLLAGKKQGGIMQHAPIAYAETASVFGENVTFRFLMKRLEQAGDKKALLALIFGKLDDMINTVVRQICFSEFERRIHGAKRRLSPEEMVQIWKDVTKIFYGADGDVFSYADIDWLWTYISHFHRRYYVYGYACGEMVTQSLYAVSESMGDTFEPLYLQLLEAGNTKNLVELLKPFNLNPEDPQFWTNGINVSIKLLLEKAEALAKEI